MVRWALGALFWCVTLVVDDEHQIQAHELVLVFV